MTRAPLALLLCLAGCPQLVPRPANCTNGTIDGREVDIDCGGGQCPACAVDRLCLTDGDCESGVCTVNRCAAPTCLDGVRNGKEQDVDCGGGCARCPGGCPDDAGCGMRSCTNGVQDGPETDLDCGGGCPGCGTALRCDVNADCAMGVCSNGRCGALCQPPSTDCGTSCVDARVDRANCGRCGNQCAASQLCTNGTCTQPCLGGTTLCAGACVDRSSNPAHCGSCNTPCPGGNSCIGGLCVPPCSPAQVQCGGTCVSTMRDPQHCGACNTVCAPGEACVGGMCSSACRAPLLSCDGGACVDARTDPENCGQCGQACLPPPRAAPACANNTCIIGACQPGFDDCNGQLGDGCEAELLVSPMHCGRCNAPCGPTEACTFGQCCGPPPPGPYQASCAMCQACGGRLQCLCNDDQAIPRPASIPLGPCGQAIRNCNGVLLCISACP